MVNIARKPSFDKDSSVLNLEYTPDSTANSFKQSLTIAVLSVVCGHL